MDIYYNTYIEKNITDINSLLENSNQLTLGAKISLQRVIHEKFSENEFDPEYIAELKNSIEQDNSKTSNLKRLSWLGIDLYENTEGSIIQKSKSALTRDILAIILGSILFLLVFPSIASWTYIAKFGLEISKLIPACLMSIAGIIGFSLLVRTIDRISFFNGFSLKKANGRIYLNHNPGFNAQFDEFSSEATLMVVENGSNSTLVISDNSTKQEVLKFKNLSLVHQNALNTMVEKFNK